MVLNKELRTMGELVAEVLIEEICKNAILEHKREKMILDRNRQYNSLPSRKLRRNFKYKNGIK